MQESAKTEKGKKGVEMKLLSDLATHFTVLTLAFTIISRKILVTDFLRKKKIPSKLEVAPPPKC